MVLFLLVTLTAAGALAQPRSAPPAKAEPLRWTAATPDEMLDHAIARARKNGPDAIAGLVIAAALDERAEFGRARAALAELAGRAELAPALADEARWLGLALTPSPRAPAWPGLHKVRYDTPADPNGMIKAFAVLGPFQDTGGGLTRREGPEAEGQSFADTSAQYSWGVYDVSWRRVLPSSATARGVPLDLYIHPRKESCTYLASKVTLAKTEPVVLRLASTGSVRLSWDGEDVAMSHDVHEKLVLDRAAVRVEGTSGDHLLAVKVCSSALADDGRVRVRLTDAGGKPLEVSSSSDLRGVKVVARPAATSKGAGPLTLPRGASRIVTPLEEALNLPTNAGIDRLLAAIVVRTLGGADNITSPRAPGLLDRVARDPATTPDALAMTGWISPFGANRSGWLNLARQRAGAASDTATAAFAQRRLVASHLGFADWAAATAEEQPLRSAKDPEARLLRASVKRQLGSPGLARAALEDLLAVAAERKDKTPLSVWSEISTLGRGDPALALSTEKRLAELQVDARGPSYVRAFRALDGAALEAAAAAVLGEQTDAEDLIQIARELLDAGRATLAREAFHLATLLAPNRPPAFRGLAAARQAALAAEIRAGKPRSEDPRLAVAALIRARDLEPGDTALKAELELRAGKGATGTTALRRTQQDDEKYIVAPEVFLARGRQAPIDKGQIFDRQLHWVRAVTYHRNKRVSQMMHYARQIVVEPRTEAELVERAMPAEGDETELILARVHKKDGRVLPAEEQNANGRRPFVRWPELETGDVVEVAVRSWTAGPVGRRGDAPFYFIDYVGSTDTQPLLYNEVVVDSPTDAPLAIDVLNGKADRVVESAKDGHKIVRLIWDNPVKVADEPLAPPLSESVPVVVGSTFATWAAFREWYRGAIQGFTEPDDQVRRLAAELTRGKASRDDKIRALFEFVADDIRYVNFVSGEWWLPNRPQELLARRQGDCDDKAILLISLLKAIGIDATEVLVQTRYTGQPSLLRSDKAAIPLFDHGIAYLPNEGKKGGMWLDATSPQSRLGPLPAMDARAVALFIDDGPGKILDTPASSPDDHGVDAEWTITLRPSGAGELTAKERHIGDSAFELRMNLREADARTQWVEQYLANGWFPTVELKGEVDFKGDLPNGAASLRYAALSDGFARREGKDLSVSTSESNTLTSQLAPLVTRTLPVVLPPRLAPGHQTRTITIVPPPGYSAAELPEDGEADGGEFGKARLEFKKDGNKVIVKRTLSFDLSTIPVDKYPKWRGWLKQVDGLMHRMVRLVPAGGAEKVARE